MQECVNGDNNNHHADNQQRDIDPFTLQVVNVDGLHLDIKITQEIEKLTKEVMAFLENGSYLHKVALIDATAWNKHAKIKKQPSNDHTADNSSQ